MTEDELVVINSRTYADLEYCRQHIRHYRIYSDSEACTCDGIHMRPSIILVELLGRYKCTTTINYESTVVDAKSIIQMTMLSMWPRSIFKLCCDGEDEIEARDAVVDSLVSGLGDGLCPDFQLFRKEYAIEQGFKPDEFGKLNNRMVLKAYANALKEGRRCVASLYSERKKS